LVDDLVATRADLEQIAIDSLQRGGAPAHEPRRERGLVFSLLRLSFTPFQVTDPKLFVFGARLLVAFRFLFERVPGELADQFTGGELAASSAQLWSLAVAAQLGNARLLPCAVGSHQSADRLFVARSWWHGRQSEVRVERVVGELAC